MVVIWAAVKTEVGGLQALGVGVTGRDICGRVSVGDLRDGSPVASN